MNYVHEIRDILTEKNTVELIYNEEEKNGDILLIKNDDNKEYIQCYYVRTANPKKTVLKIPKKITKSTFHMIRIETDQIKEVGLSGKEFRNKLIMVGDTCILPLGTQHVTSL